MRKPKNMNMTDQMIQSVEDSEETVLDLGTMDEFNYVFNDFEDQKAVTKYIKKIESTVRRSPEYKRYIKYLIEEQDLSKCTFFNKIDRNKIKGVSIEFHHYPFNLYEITESVMKSQTNFYSYPANTFQIANEVMRLHYEGLVGLVPLSVTVHELAHLGEVFINLKAVDGNVDKFIKDYNDYIDPNLLDTIRRLSILSDKNATQSNNFILKKKFQKIILEGREIHTYQSANNEIKLA